MLQIYVLFNFSCSVATILAKKSVFKVRMLGCASTFICLVISFLYEVIQFPSNVSQYSSYLHLSVMTQHHLQKNSPIPWCSPLYTSLCVWYS